MPPSSPPSLSWLHTLKAAPLRNIARATGLQTTGPKALVAARLEQELTAHRPWFLGCVSGYSSRVESRGKKIAKNDASSTSVASGGGGGGGGGHEMRILSLDMGIRNLAFACLRVPIPRFGNSSASTSTSKLNAKVELRPELTAWHRLAVEDIDTLNPVSKQEPTIQPSLPDLDITGNSSPTNHLKLNTDPPSSQKLTETTFSPSAYAATAYKIITTLLEQYKPTHILIERQRFRSGNSSAVLEWTLRVGVLEGMLYAVLRTLREERGALDGLAVVGVEPKRVVGFWEGGEDVVGEGEVDEGKENGGGGRKKEKKKTKKRLTAKEVKQVKIDLVGKWVDRALGGTPHGTPSVSTDTTPAHDDGLGDRGQIFIPSEAKAVHEVANAYLRKWRGETRGRRSAKDGQAEIGKLDDLADSLLQGITWLEWQFMKERIVQEGIEALEED